jgi:hypothetical protein
VSARAVRPPAQRAPELAALALDDVRLARVQLGHELDRVRYWRRVLALRREALVNGRVADRGVADVRAALAGAVHSRARLASCGLDVTALPELPELGLLWASPVEPGDPLGRAVAVSDLRNADGVLAAYESGVQALVRIVRDELVARYREQPLLAVDSFGVAHSLPRPRPHPDAG